MNTLQEDLKTKIKGDIDTSEEAKALFSHDASMFEMIPEYIIAPKDASDIKQIVSYVAEHKTESKNLSITVRSGGTCMSGGAVNNSIILDVNKHMNAIGEVTSKLANTQPGVFYRDFEVKTLEHGAVMPSFPASRDLCTVGGMFANNAGGERSLQYGKTEEFIEQIKVVLADGNEYVMRAISKAELDKKIAQKDFEGNLYKKVFELVDGNYEAVKAAKPGVSKDSTGYHIWNVWDREKGIFDMTRLIVGSQGTLGIVTDITFKLVPAPKNSGTLVVFLRKIDDLGTLINKVMALTIV